MSTDRISAPRRRTRFGRALLALTALGGGLAIAEQVTVQVPTLEVRQGKGSFEPAVATVRKDDKLEVVGKEGVWLKVRTPDGKTGFIKQSALTARGLAAGGRGVSSNPLVSASDAGLAGRGGFRTAEGEAYAGDKGYRSQGYFTLQEMNARVTAEKMRQFQLDGQVGAAQGR